MSVRLSSYENTDQIVDYMTSICLEGRLSRIYLYTRSITNDVRKIG